MIDDTTDACELMGVNITKSEPSILRNEPARTVNMCRTTQITSEAATMEQPEPKPNRHIADLGIPEILEDDRVAERVRDTSGDTCIVHFGTLRFPTFMFHNGFWKLPKVDHHWSE